MLYNDSTSGSSGDAMQQFDRQKFKAMIHYMVSRCPPEATGRTKLNKAGFYADMLTYLQLGRPMTGETYVKQTHGPAAHHLRSSLRELIVEGALEERLVPYFGYSRYEYVSRRAPDISRISADEKAIIDEVTDFVCIQHSARSISEFSHTETWKAARQGEELPYFAATELLLDGDDVDEADRAWADEELQRRATERPKYREVRGESIRTVCRELHEARRRHGA